MRPLDNVHVRAFSPLVSPREMDERMPISETARETVYSARETIRRILRREDPRLLVVVGPCSIHDDRGALEYAERLAEAHHRLADRLFIVMRVYLEKPRTTVGWRGLINDPHMDGSYDMAEGLRRARELLRSVNDLGLPAATEMLDPFTPQFLSGLISLGAIGARTTESQTHRALASGVSMPVGFKNSTDGSVQAAVNSIVSMRSAHSFLGIDQTGRSAVVKTTGNPDGFVILRGSRLGTNYDADSVAQAVTMMTTSDLPQAVMVDCSHANSGSDHTRQRVGWDAVLAQRPQQPALIGMMIESNLFEGKQPIPADLSQLRYGVSVTDACVGWETTEQMLMDAFTA